MSACDDVRTARFVGTPLAPAAAAHAEGCDRCRSEAVELGQLTQVLARYAVAAPPSGLDERVLAAATPLLARYARRAFWLSVARALAWALVPLPFVVAFDVYALSHAYALLRAVLPRPLSLYVIVNYATLLALLLTLTYGAIPFLAARQVRTPHEEHHA